MIVLVDDGTLDTVVRCTECGDIERYPTPDSDITTKEFILECLQDMTDMHECPWEASEAAR